MKASPGHKQPTAGHQGGLEDTAPLLHFLVPWQEWSSPHGEAWLNRAAEPGEPEAGPVALPRRVGCFTGLPLAALPEFSFLLCGFFFFHLCSTLSSPSANVKGHQEALGLRRSAKKRLLRAEWPTSVTREEALRTEDAASAPGAVRPGQGTWTAWLSYSECLKCQRDLNQVGITPNLASHVPYLTQQQVSMSHMTSLKMQPGSAPSSLSALSPRWSSPIISAQDTWATELASSGVSLLSLLSSHQAK